jgi:hypothetical protein
MVAVGSRRPIDRNAGDALTDLPAVRGRMFDWLPRNPGASHPLKDRGGKGGTRGTDRDFGAARFTPQGLGAAASPPRSVADGVRQP